MQEFEFSGHFGWVIPLVILLMGIWLFWQILKSPSPVKPKDDGLCHAFDHVTYYVPFQQRCDKCGALVTARKISHWYWGSVIAILPHKPAE